MNKVILIGRLTRDPEVRYSQSADPVAIARFSLAVNRRFKRDGEPDADFINCVAFGRTGEFIEKYFKKGMQIAVTGRLNVRSYEDQQSGQRRWTTDVVIDEAEFTESRSAYEGRSQSSGQQAHDDSMAERYTPPTEPSGSMMSSAPMASQAPEGFAAITESIDDDDLPF